RVSVLAFLVLPFARLQPALDVDLPAFLQVLAGDLRLAPEKDHGVPFGALLLLAVLVFPGIGRRHPDIGYGVAAGRVTRLGVPAEVANQNHLVHGCHSETPIDSMARL